jgi:hypothetical protein
MTALEWNLANYRLPVVTKKLHKSTEATGLRGKWNETQMWKLSTVK